MLIGGVGKFEFRNPNSATNLSPFLDTISQEIVQVGSVVDFLSGDVLVVFHSVEGNLVVLLNDITRAWISVARLSGRANIDHKFLVLDGEDVLGLVGGDKLEALQKNARDMGVPLKTTLGDESKELFHFLLVVNVFWKDVLVDRVACRAMNVEPGIVAMDPGQCAQKIPTPIDLAPVARGIFQLIASPKDGPFRPTVKTFGIKHGPLVVITQEANFAFFDHQVETFARIGAISDDVTHAIDFVDVLVGNVRKHLLERFEIAMNVADNCASHRTVTYQPGNTKGKHASGAPTHFAGRQSNPSV